jgi:2-methylcitrate dehydratase PrpD
LTNNGSRPTDEEFNVSNTERLAGFATELQFADLPEEVVHKAKELTLGALGLQLAASTTPWSKVVYRYMQSQGGTPQSTVVNYGLRTSASNAAFANAAFGHGFEMDDNHAQTSLKGSAVAIPTAMAVGEQRLASGRDYITALVTGYEVMIRAVKTIAPSLWSRGNHPTGHVGALGAAVITGMLHQLDRATLTHALGSAANHMVGFQEVPSSGRGHIKRIYGSMAAAGGIRAALLAAEGMTGPATTLDMGSGFLRSMDVKEGDAGNLTADLGSTWHILDVHHKIYAQDGFIQPMSEALERIRATHSFNIDDIDEIWVGTNTRAKNEVVGFITDPQTIIDAQFSANFGVALFLVKGGAGFLEYTEENLRDPKIRELSKRVVLEVDDEIEREFQSVRPRGAKVVIRLKSGKELKEHVHNLRSMTPDDVDAKFRTLSTVVLDKDRSERLRHEILNLEGITNMAQLRPLLVQQL